MLTKIGQQMLTKIDRQLFHTIATDARLAGANQQMFLTYTIDYVTPDRFFCLFFKPPLYHYYNFFISNILFPWSYPFLPFLLTSNIVVETLAVFFYIS